MREKLVASECTGIAAVRIQSAESPHCVLSDNLQSALADSRATGAGSALLPRALPALLLPVTAKAEARQPEEEKEPVVAAAAVAARCWRAWR